MPSFIDFVIFLLTYLRDALIDRFLQCLVLVGFLFVLHYTVTVWGSQLASASGFPVCVAVYCKCMGVSTRKR